jgi:hypothetical protein
VRTPVTLRERRRTPRPWLADWWHTSQPSLFLAQISYAVATSTLLPFSFKTCSIRKMALATPSVAEGLKKLHCSWHMFSSSLNAICFDFSRQSDIERFTPVIFAQVLI